MAYLASDHTTTNKPLGIGSAVPTDARSYFFDKANFLYRPYVSTAEVVAYLDTATKRTGSFPVYINDTGTLNGSTGVLSGGKVKEYWFTDPVAGTLEWKRFMTADEATKLANTRERWKGTFTTFANLQAGAPTGELGDEADVDAGAGANSQRYIWDAQNGWVPASPAATSFSAASNAEVLAGTDNSKGVTPKSLAEGVLGLLSALATLDKTSIVAAINEIKGALTGKVDVVAGKGLSTNDYTSAEKTKLEGIATNATANASDTQLRNRSTHTGTQAASTITGLATVATSGSYNDLTDKPELAPPPEETPTQQGVQWGEILPTASITATHVNILASSPTINGTVRNVPAASLPYSKPSAGMEWWYAIVLDFSNPASPVYRLIVGDSAAANALTPTPSDTEKFIKYFLVQSAGVVETPTANKLYPGPGQNTDGGMTQDAATKLGSFVPADANNETGFWAGLIQASGRVFNNDAIGRMFATLTANFTFGATLLSLLKEVSFSRTVRFTQSSQTVTTTSHTLDCSLANKFILTLASNTNLILSNLRPGSEISIVIIQNGVGGFTVTFSGLFNFLGKPTPSVFLSPGAVTRISGEVVGGTLHVPLPDASRIEQVTVSGNYTTGNGIRSVEVDTTILSGGNATITPNPSPTEQRATLRIFNSNTTVGNVVSVPGVYSAGSPNGATEQLGPLQFINLERFGSKWYKV